MTKSGGEARCVECGRPFAAAARGRPRRYCGRACQARAYRARSDRGPSGPQPGTQRAGGASTARGRAALAPPPARASAHLDRRTLVRTAIGMADEHGIDPLTMRSIAARLDVPVMSLYRHVPSKQQLIGTMVEAVLAEQPAADDREEAGGVDAHSQGRGEGHPDGGDGRNGRSPLRELLEREARREWELYRRHPWLLRVLATTRPPFGRALLATVDRSMGTLTRAGLDPETAQSVYLLLSGYVQGMALMEVGEVEAVRDTGVSGAGWWAGRRSRLSDLAEVDAYPWLRTMLADRMRSPGAAERAEWFDFGLRRVLDGIEVFVAGAGRG